MLVSAYNSAAILKSFKLNLNLAKCFGVNKIILSTLFSTNHYHQDSHDGMPKTVPALGTQELHDKWYPLWESNSFFFNDKYQHRKKRPPFVMMLPPPNITGTLHLGHALTVTLQDAIVRWHGMKGHETLWVPGCDHAGIATQVVLEKHLQATRGISRKQLTREQFQQEAWSWKSAKEKRIYEQLQRLGAALNWEKSVFTLDKGMNEAVSEAFVILFDKGLIYRKDRFVNYCCALQSVIADIEVNHQKLSGPTEINVPGYDKPLIFGEIYDVSYSLVPNSSTSRTDALSETITVSTTSPETIPADTAIMVHPSDDRYKHLIGRQVYNLYRPNVVMPIIADEAVDINKGTGAVKVTPAHSEVDYNVGLRHDLPYIMLYNDDGSMNDTIPELEGLHRYEAREKILNDLKLRNHLVSKRAHPVSLSLCSRTNDILIPIIKKQWYIKVKDMVDRSLEAVESGNLNIQPDSQRRVWNEWMRKTRDDDWCVSRQLWWGHQLPVYQIEGTDDWVAASSHEKALIKASEKLKISKDSITLKRDQDVLDTWFSSALFPFAALGWPQKTDNLAKYYPTSLLVTGQDILFFWVARMVMLGTELTGVLPFKSVQLHALLMDESGGKMSKSKGNVVDPMVLVGGDHKAEEEGRTDLAVGADVLRMTLLSQDISSDYIPFSPKMLHSFKIFTNKMWQTVRFLRFHCRNKGVESLISIDDIPKTSFSSMDKWILHNTHSLVNIADESMTTRSLSLLVNYFVRFWKTQLCDVYLEAIKLELQKENDNNSEVCALTPSLVSLSVLRYSIYTAIKSIAPVMPYICEEIYQWLPRVHNKNLKDSVMAENYPTVDGLNEYCDPHLADQVNFWLKVVAAFRALKFSYNVTSKDVRGSVIISDAQLLSSSINEEMNMITAHLAKMSHIQIVNSKEDEENSQELSNGLVRSTVNERAAVSLELQGAVNINKELERLTKKTEKLTKLIKRLQKRPSSHNKFEVDKTLTELEQLTSLMNFIRTLRS